MATISSTHFGFPQNRRRNVSQLSGVSGVSGFDDAASLAPSSMAGSDDENGDSYRTKRVRNNVAVRKSREKSKAKAGQAEMHFRQLREENQFLEKRQDNLKKELAMLKESFIQQMKEQIQKSQAYDTLTQSEGCRADNNNNDQSIYAPNAVYFISATENGYPTVAASDAIVVANAMVPPAASGIATFLKDDVGANATVGAMIPAAAPSEASLGKFLDLKKEKEQLRKNNNNNGGLWFKSASL